MFNKTVRKTVIAFTVVAISLVAASVFAQNEEEELYLRPAGSRFNGPVVVRLQKFLMHHGYDLGADGADGWFGSMTDRALRDYQRDWALGSTGRIAVKDVPELPEWTYNLSFSILPKSRSLPPAPVEWFEPIDVNSRFGRIVLERDPEFSEGIRVLVPEGTGMREIESVNTRATHWSPSRRYVAMIDFDKWKSALRMVVVDVLLKQAVSVDLAEIVAQSDNAGDRTYAMIRQMSWSNEHLYFRLDVDYPGPSGVPGADDTIDSDPISIAWLGIEDPLPEPGDDTPGGAP